MTSQNGKPSAEETDVVEMKKAIATGASKEIVTSAGEWCLHVSITVSSKVVNSLSYLMLLHCINPHDSSKQGW